MISAITQREKLTEIVELPQTVHPWFIGVQFHPEFKSTPWGGHPLFKSFIHAALEHQARARREKVRRVKLCGFDVGLDRPLFLIAGPCVVESEQLQMDVAGRPEGNRRPARRAVHLQVELRQGEPLERHLVSAAPASTRGSRSSPRSSASSACRSSPTCTARTRSARAAVGRRRAADAGLPVPADRLHPRRRAERQAGQHQEGPVPRRRTT